MSSQFTRQSTDGRLGGLCWFKLPQECGVWHMLLDNLELLKYCNHDSITKFDPTFGSYIIGPIIITRQVSRYLLQFYRILDTHLTHLELVHPIIKAGQVLTFKMINTHTLHDTLGTMEKQNELAYYPLTFGRWNSVLFYCVANSKMPFFLFFQ